MICVIRGRRGSARSYYSEIMITLFIIVFLIDVFVVILLIFVYAFLFVRVIVTHLMLSRLPILAEALLSLAHLTMLSSSEHGVFVIALVVEDFLLFGLLLLSFEGFDTLRLLLPSLLIFQIVHV